MTPEPTFKCRHLVADVFLGPLKQKNKFPPCPDKWKPIHEFDSDENTELVWCSNDSEVFLAYYFKKSPHWMYANKCEIVKNISNFCRIEHEN